MFEHIVKHFSIQKFEYNKCIFNDHLSAVHITVRIIPYNHEYFSGTINDYHVSTFGSSTLH